MLMKQAKSIVVLAEFPRISFKFGGQIALIIRYLDYQKFGTIPSS